jgi:putative aldouronate transport system permease protein
MKSNQALDSAVLLLSQPKKGFRANRDIPLYLLILPGFLLLLVFNYIPIFGIVISFQNFSPFLGIAKSPWIGFENFAYFLFDSKFWEVMKNTLLINLLQLIIGFPVPILFALFLNELYSARFKKIMQTISYLPYFVSWVVAAGIVTSILSPSTGLLNTVLQFLGMEPIYFLTKPQYFRTIIVLSGIWKNFGMNAVYYIAAFSAIDLTLYEAAKIDGAGKMRQIWHITLPGIRNIAMILLILQIGNMVSIGFEQIFLLYNPMVYEVGDVISTYTYRLGIEQTRYSLTTAIGFTQSIVNFILVYSANRISRAVSGWSLW